MTSKGAICASEYDKSYIDIAYIEDKLKDKTVFNVYKKAILDNSHLFTDKIVLNIGCGTGLLSMLAARAGAKKVYGVDESNMIQYARKIVSANGYDNCIELFEGNIEEIELPVQKVDIILGDWIGYFLFFDSLITSVIYARDKWLAKDGIMMPDKACLYLLGVEDRNYKNDMIHFWKNVYGFDMSNVLDTVFAEPLTDSIPKKSIMTTPFLLKEFNLRTIKIEDLNWNENFEIKAKYDNCLDAFIVYFDVLFSKGNDIITLKTGPLSKETRWKQTIFYVKDNLFCRKDETIKGSFSCIQKSNKEINITLNIDFEGEMCKSKSTQYYRMI